MTQEGLKPIRRLVTGNDARGKSKVVWDGPAPNTHPVATGPGRGQVDLWVWHESPAPLSGTSDDGNLPYDFPGPPRGGHLRVVQGGERAIRTFVNRSEDWLPLMMMSMQELGVRVSSIRVSEPSLDDVFLHYTGKEVVQKHA